jgi:hypothetical protein
MTHTVTKLKELIRNCSDDRLNVLHKAKSSYVLTTINEESKNEKHNKINYVSYISEYNNIHNESNNNRIKHSQSCILPANILSNDKNNDNKYKIDIWRLKNKVDNRTTLMIKNIPNKYNQQTLV